MKLHQRLHHTFLTRHPGDGARAMEELSAEELSQLFTDMDVEAAMPALCLVSPALLADALAQAASVDGGRILQALPINVKLAVLPLLNAGTREHLLAALPGREASLLKRLLSYPARTAATLLDPHVFSVSSDLTVELALQRSRASRRPLRYYVYVEDTTHRLTGVVSMRQLMQADPGRRISEIMHRNVVALPATHSLSEVVASQHWKDHHMLPVVDNDEHLLGVIRYETMHKLREEQDAESGVGSVLQVLMTLGEVYWLGLGMALGVGDTEEPAEQAHGR